MNTFAPLLAVPLILFAGVQAYIRLSPVDPTQWHFDITSIAEKSVNCQVVSAKGGAVYRCAVQASARDTLAKLDRIALATPRTRRVAGSAAEGRVTWETRSLFWGFRDYTTAQVQDKTLQLYARQRFGSSDHGVNAARLRDWLTWL